MKFSIKTVILYLCIQDLLVWFFSPLAPKGNLPILVLTMVLMISFFFAYLIVFDYAKCEFYPFGLSIFMILIIFTYWLICYIFVVALGFIVYPSNNISPHIYYKNLKTVCFCFSLRTLVYCYHTFYFYIICCSKPCNLLLFLH